MPAGNIVDPGKQLTRKVQELLGSEDYKFSGIFSPIAILLGEMDGVRLQAMTYDSNQSEIRLTLTAPSFKQIEMLRGRLESEQLNAELTSSNQEGQLTRARLRIRG